MKRYLQGLALLLSIPAIAILLTAATAPNKLVSELPLGTNFSPFDFILMNTGNPPKTVRVAVSNVVAGMTNSANFPISGTNSGGGGNDKIATNIGTGFRTTLIDPTQRGGSNYARYLQATQTISALDGVGLPTSKKVAWPSSSVGEVSGNLDFAGNFIHLAALNLTASNRLLGIDAGNILTNLTISEADILRGHTNGNIIYLDTLGNDNSGQIGKFNNPFQTPTNAAAAIRADGRANLLLYIRPGDYTVDTMRSGVNGAPVWFSKITNLTIWAYGARFISTTTNEGCQIIYSNCPNLKIYGLTQIGTRQTGASGDRSGVLFGATGWADTNLVPTLVDCVWKDWSRHANTPFAGACTPDATIVRCAGYNIGATNTADLGFADGQVWGVKGPRQTILSMRGSNNVREVEAEGVLMACQSIDGLLIDDLRSVGTRDAAIYIIPDFLGAYYNNVTVTRLFVDGGFVDGANSAFSRGVVDRGGTNHVYDGGTIQNCYESMLMEADSTNNIGLKIVNFTFLNANQHHIDLADNQNEIGKISDAYIAGNTFILSGYDCIGGTFSSSIIENNTILNFATNGAASSYPAIWVYTAGNANDPATNNIIRNNRISNGRVGIRVETNAIDNFVFGNDLRNLAVSDYAINDSRNFRGIVFPEVSSQPTAPTNTVLVYGKESGGATKLYYQDDTGVEVGPLGTGGSSGSAVLATASSAGATSLSVTVAPSNVVAQSAYVVIDPYSTNAETRRISSISGTTITPVVQKSASYKRVQFIASTKTIQQRRSIGSISGNGATVTVDTTAAHNLITGDTVYIWGTTNFNNSVTGPHAVTVTDADTFTYSAAINTNDSAVGYVIHASDINQLGQLFNTQTILISGSASNNGMFTVATVDQQAGDGIGAGSAITVNETITNEVSGLTNTIVINLNKAHVAGAPVLFLPGGAINVRYYGAVADALTGSASRNRLAIQRAIDDAYYQEVYNVYVPGGKVYYVDGEIQLEREQNFGGDRENVSAIRATGITFGTNTYLLHGRRDGCIQNVQVGTFKQRYYIHDLSLLGDGLASGNGFGFNLQQPCSIDRVRVDGFRAFGISIGGQEASFNNIMVTDCGGTNGAAPIWLNGMSFSYWNALNVEQTGVGATGVVWITSGGGTSAKNNTFINTHFEHTAGTTNVTFQVQDAFQTVFINTHDSIYQGSTTFRFNETAGQTPRALTYQIIGAEATGNQSETNTYAIDDLNRGDKIHWDRAEQRSFKAYIENYIAGPHNFSTPSANADGAFPICLPGLGSRELFLGSGNDDGSGVPIFRSILGANTEFHWKAYDATTNVVFSVGNGGVTNAGWQTVGGAVTNKSTLRVQGISTLETNLDLKALASSSTPPTNHVRVYAKDGPVHSALAWKDDDGNETAINLSTPSAGQVLAFHDANTLTNATALGGGLGYTITLAAIGFNPADSTTYYVGADIGNAPLTSYAYEKVEIPKAGTIKRVFMKMIYGGSASGETVSHYIRINDTTDVAQIDAVYNADFDYNNTSVSTAVTAGQYIAFKITTPAWVTNPTNVRYYCIVYIE